MSEEKTEKATPQKLKKVKEEGQVPRTKELPTVCILMFAFVFLIFLSEGLVEAATHTMTRGLEFDHSELDVTNAGFGHEIKQAGKEIFSSLGVLFVGSIFLAIWSNCALGGFQFKLSHAKPDLTKLDPIKGLGKLFSAKQLIELLKSILKAVMVGIPLWFIIEGFFWNFTRMRLTHTPLSIFEALLTEVLGWGLLFASLFIVLVAIDVPFQIYTHHKQNKMTKQEIKEEYKNTEGDPLVKAKVRQIQRAMSQQGAKSRVVDAAVVIVNPSHYSVALEFNEGKMQAPVVVGLGMDALAFAIRKTAKENGIPIIEIPALARALYANSVIGERIPESLYRPVASVVALIYQLDKKAATDLDKYVDQNFIDSLEIDEDALPRQVKRDPPADG